MTNLRPVPGAASEPTVEPPLRQPDLFERTIWIVQEIGEAADKFRNEAPSVVARIRAGRSGRDVEMLDAATAELLVMLNAANILTDTLAKQIDKHRQERVGR